MDLRYTVRHFFFLNYFEDACVSVQIWLGLWMSLVRFNKSDPIHSRVCQWQNKNQPLQSYCKTSKSHEQKCHISPTSNWCSFQQNSGFHPDFIPSTALLYPLLAQPQISPRSEKTSAPQVAWDWDSSQRRLVTRPWPFPPPHGSPVGREVPSPESARRWALVRGGRRCLRLLPHFFEWLLQRWGKRKPRARAAKFLLLWNTLKGSFKDFKGVWCYGDGDGMILSRNYVVCLGKILQLQ